MGKSQGFSLYQKAEKKANQSGGLFSWGPSATRERKQDAADMFRDAANKFKVDQCFKEAGDSFLRAAECAIKADERNEANQHFWEAAKAYKQTNPDLAVEAYQRAVNGLLESGRFRQAADRMKEIASIYLNELADLTLALESYEKAAQWYEQEDAKATASACYKDVADIAAQLEQYKRAISNYDKVIKQSLESPLTRFSVKEYFFKAGLCWLAAGDLVDAGRAIATFAEMDPSFMQTREHKFLSGAIDAIEQGDQEQYTGLVVDYDKMTKLDNWKTTIMLKIKRSIDEEPGLT